jgi:hypothetical protein
MFRGVRGARSGLLEPATAGVLLVVHTVTVVQRSGARSGPPRT